MEENVLAGGFGSAVLEFLNREKLHAAQIQCLGFPDAFVEQGSRSELLQLYKLTAQDAADVARTFLQDMNNRG